MKAIYNQLILIFELQKQISSVKKELTTAAKDIKVTIN